MPPPPTRPIQYQTVSLSSEASAAAARTSARLNRPFPASAPPARRNGTAGSGSPICSASTQPKTTRYPCRTRTSRTPSIALRQDIRSGQRTAQVPLVPDEEEIEAHAAQRPVALQH